MIEMLLAAKADMFISSSDGMMPIHRAAAEGHLDAMNVLIEHGLCIDDPISVTGLCIQVHCETITRLQDLPHCTMLHLLVVWM